MGDRLHYRGSYISYDGRDNHYGDRWRRRRRRRRRRYYIADDHNASDDNKAATDDHDDHFATPDDNDDNDDNDNETPPSTTSTPPALGVYAGTNNQAGVNSFAATTGAQVTMAETYLPWGANTGTSAGAGWSYLTTRSTLASWLSSWAGTSDQMVIGVPMVAINSSGTPENTLAQGAAGDENANFVAIAQNLVALGFGNAILRPGWEFDGTWYPWTVQSDTDAANFATYFQNVVTAMRSVPGANFKFLWSPAGFQSLSWNINDAYPGNAYVNYVSFDIYDWSLATDLPWRGPKQFGHGRPVQCRLQQLSHRP